MCFKNVSDNFIRTFYRVIFSSYPKYSSSRIKTNIFVQKTNINRVGPCVYSIQVSSFDLLVLVGLYLLAVKITASNGRTVYNSILKGFILLNKTHIKRPNRETGGTRSVSKSFLQRKIINK